LLTASPTPFPPFSQDAVNSYYETACRELRTLELESLSKDRDYASSIETHSIELRVYEQKVKHLTFESASTARTIEIEAHGDATLEERSHMVREALLRVGKGDMVSRVRSMEDNNADAIRTQQLMADKSLQKLRSDFIIQLESLRTKYEARAMALQRDLALRSRVELHEADERRNLHIHQLSQAHEESFAEMRAYYNDVTRANVELIDALKGRIAAAGEKATANQRMVLEIAEENKRLSEPLRQALQERAVLVADLKDASRDASSLQLARNRLAGLRTSFAELTRGHALLEDRFSAVTRERDTLYERFETTVRAAAARASERSNVLEARLDAAEADAAAAGAAAVAVVSAGALDPSALDAAASRLSMELEIRNNAIRELQEVILRLAKGRDEAVRTLTEKLTVLGVDRSEASAGQLTAADGGGIVLVSESLVSAVEGVAAFPGPAGLIAAQRTSF
jgi:hypothetical protein